MNQSYSQNDPFEQVNVHNDPNHQHTLSSLKAELGQFFQEYQTPEHSGTNLATQPPANGNEQWRAPK